MRSNALEQYKSRLKLSNQQRQVLIGILLGDATLYTQNRGRTYSLKIEHSFKQRHYIEHLYQIFQDWVLGKPRLRNVRLRNGKTYKNIKFWTVSHASFRCYAQQFYRGKKKIVPKLINRWLTPKTLAYWFMDDGSVKSKQSKGVIFNTQGYDKQDVLRLIRVMGNKFCLKVKIRRQKEGHQIYVSGKSFERFKQLVLQHMLPEMRYKIPEARRTHLHKE